MTRESKHAAIPSLLLALLCVIGQQAGAEDAVRAEAAFEEGKRLYHDESFEAAAAAFRKAYELRPNWKILYNIGQSEAASKRYGLAVEAFERYLVMGGDDIDQNRRDEVLEEMEKFRKIVGSIEIKAPDGLVVLVDDRKPDWTLDDDSGCYGL
jgi:tetratricopeptide (TPR) repeat protein